MKSEDPKASAGYFFFGKVITQSKIGRNSETSQNDRK